MTQISAILLAAGLSSRMKGPNKLLLKLGEKSILARTYEELAGSEVAEVIVVTGRDESLIKEQLKLRPQDRFVHNTVFADGMITSIQKGVSSAQGDAFIICLADMPELRAVHYNTLTRAFNAAVVKDPGAILVPSVNGKRGNPVIFSAVYQSAILAHTEMNGCRKLVKDNQKHLSEYITDDLAYLSDVDTAEDYRKLHE